MKSNKALSASFRENNDKNVKYVPLFDNSTSTPETRSSCVRLFLFFFPFSVPGNHSDVGGDREPEDVEVVDDGVRGQHLEVDGFLYNVRRNS